MIKIDKSKASLPESLIPPADEISIEKTYRTPNKVTHQKRLIMEAHAGYDDSANSSYKHETVKSELLKVYNSKCAYCDKFHHRNDLEVEHYRPKGHYPPKNRQAGVHQIHGGYWWLSLSWDNLLLSCGDCNRPKSSIFDIEDEANRVTYNTKDHQNWSLINKLSSSYDSQEKPLLINPEVEDPEIHFGYSIDGHIHGKDNRGKHTCRVCNLDRDELVEDRYGIIEEFKSQIINQAGQFPNDSECFLKSVKGVMASFVVRTKKSKESFIAFREQAIQDKWLNNIILDVYKHYFKE